MRKPLLALFGLLAASTLSLWLLYGQGSTDSVLQAATSARSLSADEVAGSEDDHDESWRARVLVQLRERVDRIALAIEVTTEEREALLSVLLNEANRLDAATDRAADPRMHDALVDYLISVAEWKERELQRVLGATLTAQVASFEAGIRAER